MRPIPPTPKSTKERESKFASMCNRDEFFVESKETKNGVALLVKKEITPPARVSEKVEPLLEDSKGIVNDELPEGLPPMKNIQPHIILFLEQVYLIFHTTG